MVKKTNMGCVAETESADIGQNQGAFTGAKITKGDLRKPDKEKNCQNQTFIWLKIN